MSDIVTLIETATPNKHPIHSVSESPEYKRWVNSAGTHDAYQSGFSCILKSGNSSHISGTVCSVMAYKAQDSWLISGSYTHSFPPLKYEIGVPGFKSLSPSHLCPKALALRILVLSTSRYLHHRRVDLGQEFFISEMLQLNCPCGTSCITETISFAENRIHNSLLDLSDFMQLNGAICTG